MFIKKYEYHANITGSDPGVALNSDLNSKIDDYLSFNPNCDSSSYYLDHWAYKASMKLQTCDKPKYEKEVFLSEKTNEILYRNFIIMQFISGKGEIFFPYQDTLINCEKGVLLIFPASFMFPYVTKQFPQPYAPECTFIKWPYFFDKSTFC